MATIVASRHSLFFFTLLFYLINPCQKTLSFDTTLSFSFNHFHKNDTLDSGIDLHGGAMVEDSAVRFIGAGKVLYRKPVRFSKENAGFSTYFCFSISSSGAGSLTYFVDSSNWKLFRLSKNVFSTEFAVNTSSSHIAIRVTRAGNSEICAFSSANALLGSGEKLHSWIEYDEFAKKVEVRVSKSRVLKPENPFISCAVDISSALHEEALLGTPYLKHSEPLDPRAYMMASQFESSVYRRSSSRRLTAMAWLFGLVCGALLTFMAVFVWNAISSRRPAASLECTVHPVEDDEKNDENGLKT